MRDYIVNINQAKVPDSVYCSKLNVYVPVKHIKMMTDERWKELSEKRKIS